MMRALHPQSPRPGKDRLLEIAAKVIAKAGREHPADAVLRAELKTAGGISRDDGRRTSRTVFAYYRWRAWLAPDYPMAEQLGRAGELDRAFQKNSRVVTEAELRRAVPSWTSEQVEVTTEWLRTLQTEPPLWLRAKAGQGRVLAEKLGDCEVSQGGVAPDAIRYFGANDLFRLAEFQSGEFELQDLSSQAVGLVCDPQPGQTWWDACAGEGGKLLHLCDLMRNKGLVWASDRADWRLKKLKRRAARAGAFNYRAALWDGSAKLPTKTKFDGILVDAPCTGIGTWQRNPHARWTTTVSDVLELAAVQEQLLANVIPGLKPGGRLIYSVCTLSRAETSGVAERITRRFPALRPIGLKNPLRPNDTAVEELWLWPQDVNGNGMFIRGWQNAGV
jgi:16S rRNA (cytosine967-C5)-methyltransferase